MIINGTNFQSGAIADFGPLVSVNAVSFVSSTQVIANVTFRPAAGGCPPNLHRPRVTVANPDGGFGTLPNAGRIVPTATGTAWPTSPWPNSGAPTTAGSPSIPTSSTRTAMASATPVTTASASPTPIRPITISNGVGDACETERVATLEQLTPPGGVLFGEPVPVRVSVDFNCGATNCLAFCPNVYNLAFIVTDMTPGSPTLGQELDQSRIWEGPPVHTSSDATPVTGGDAHLLDRRGSGRVLPAGGESHLQGRGDVLQPRDATASAITWSAPSSPSRRRSTSAAPSPA